jgi:hypothetical protein
MMKGSRAIDVALSPVLSLKGTRLDIPKSENKIVLSYISSEVDEHLVSITLLIDEVPSAAGGLRLEEIGEDDITIELVAVGSKLDSNPLLTFKKIVPPKKEDPKAGTAAAANGDPKAAKAPPSAAPKAPPKQPAAKIAVPTDPKQRAIFIAKQREALIKAKQDAIAKQKQQAIEETKYIINKAKEIAVLKKNMPPIDTFKFPGMPGPPPFKPKAAAPVENPHDSAPAGGDAPEGAN